MEERVAQSKEGSKPVLLAFEVSASGAVSLSYAAAGLSQLLHGAADLETLLARSEPGDRQPLLDSLTTAARSNSPWRFLWRLWVEGRSIQVEGEAHPVAAASGSVTLHGFLQEESELETQLQQVKTSLRDCEQLRGLVLTAAKMGSYDWDMLSNRISWSPIHEALWGFAPGEFDGTFGSFASRLHPDDLPGTNAEIERCLAAQLPYEREYRVLWPNGSVRWVLARGEFVFSPEGRPVRMVGVVMDTTARHVAEEELRASERRARRVIEVAPVPALLHHGTKITYLNPAFVSTFGYSLGDIPTVSEWWMRMFPDPEYRKQVLQQREQRVEQARRENIPLGSDEVTITTKDGSQRFVLIRASPPEDSLADSLVMFIDITERKRAEEELRNNERRSQSIVEAISVPVMINDGKSVLYLNRAFISTFGYSLEDMPTLARWMELAYPDPKYRKNHVMEGLKEVLNKGALSGPGELVIRTKDGREVFAAVTASKLEASTQELLVVYVDETRHKKAEEALRVNMNRSQKIIDATPVPAIIQNDRNITYLNKSFVSVFGYSLEDISDVNTWWQRAYPNPDYRRIVLKSREQALDAVKDNNPSEPVEITVTAKNKEEHIVLVTASPLESLSREFMVAFVDVTGLKRAEEKLRENERRSRSIIEAIPVPIVIHDGVLVSYVNPAFVSTFGYSLEDVPTFARWWELACPDPEYRRWALAERARRIEKAIQTNSKPEPIEFTITTKDKGQRSVIASATPLEGAQNQIMIVLIDLTERKQAEEARFKLERQIQHAQKLESLGVLAGGIAHDFNNMLVSIVGNADLALMELSPMSPARESIQAIQTGALRASELAKQMLAYSGRGKFVVHAIHLNEMVTEMSHLLEVAISKKAILRFDLAKNLPTFAGDATQIRQIIMNLITNASEAIGDRSGVISIVTGAMYCDPDYLEACNQTVRSAQYNALPSEGMFVFLEVADTGSGMSKETIDKIFDPFFTTKFTGRGLGLSACLGIVRGHNGAVRIYSEVGRGTTFKILFPANEATRDVVSTQGTQVAWVGRGTVLVADDEETVRSITKKMLERLGFRVLLANDGREALGLFKEKRDEISFVVLDLTMPHMDGEQTFRELRALTPNVKVIMTSGYHEQEVSQRFLGKGLAAFLQKPYGMTEFVTKVRGIFEGSTPDSRGDE